MPCLLGCLALSVPRFVLFVLWLWGYTSRAFESNLWFFLGFIFLPFTTLAYAWAKNTSGSVEGIYLAIVVFAVLVDLGVVSFGRRRRRRDGPGGGGGGNQPPSGPREITVTGQRVG